MLSACATIIEANDQTFSAITHLPEARYEVVRDGKQIAMAKPSGSSGGRKQGGGKGAGWPSKTGNPSGGGRDNNPPSGKGAGWPSTTGNPSGGGRDNAPPKGGKR